MLKFQITLIVILISCVAFISCERSQKMLEPALPDAEMPAETMDMMVDMTMYHSWLKINLPTPGPQADATSPAETGEVHGKGSRAVYINDTGVMALRGDSLTTFPAGTEIVKEIMDDTNMFVQTVAKMTKTDDPMYVEHNGWMYVQYARPSADGKDALAGGGSLAGSAGCHGCHAKADTDSVFVASLTLLQLVGANEDLLEVPQAAEGTGAGDMGDGDAGAGDMGDGDAGAGDMGDGDAGAGDMGDGDAGAGDMGDGDAGAGDMGDGDAGAGDMGDGDAGAGDMGDGDAGAGDMGDGDAGAGDMGDGDAGAGDMGDGDAGAGDMGDGDAGAGGA